MKTLTRAGRRFAAEVDRMPCSGVFCQFDSGNQEPGALSGLSLSLNCKIRLHWSKSPDRLIMRRGNGSNKEYGHLSRMKLNGFLRVRRLAAEISRVIRAISDQDGVK